MSAADESDDELFRAEMAGVQRKASEPRVAVNRSPVSAIAAAARREAAARDPKRDLNFLTLSDIELLDPWYPLEFRRSGVQHGVFRRFKQGKYEMEARLDLHRLTVEQARHELFGFIREALTYELRNVMIVPGRGTHSKAPEAILKSYVNQWLPAFEEVLAFCSAQPMHGGTGAVYVMLRKGEREKQKNREQLQRGRTV